ncbi:MAG TPA: DUF4345 family protein [Chakrabartia sp.]|jgi:hypothetical protein|nr:DUF4345 family protein [Chakrabartia sp.]
MAQLPRILVALAALFFLFMGVQFWFALDTAAQSFGLSPVGLIGRASIRADVGGLFIGGGLIMLHAAWKQCRMCAGAAATIVGVALLGRFITVALDGMPPGGVPPMVVEAVIIAILLWARSSWKRA